LRLSPFGRGVTVTGATLISATSTPRV
jgi:hypothetical protein